jgi:hypothetical protein
LGRRLLREKDGSHVRFAGSAGPDRFLISDFWEDRAGEHVSLDYFWEANSSEKHQAFARKKLAEIVRTQRLDVAGWCIARADALLRVPHIVGMQRDPEPDNPRHVLLHKAPYLLINPDDDARTRKDKARAVAIALRDYFNQDPNSPESEGSTMIEPQGEWLPNQTESSPI